MYSILVMLSKIRSPHTQKHACWEKRMLAFCASWKWCVLIKVNKIKLFHTCLSNPPHFLCEITSYEVFLVCWVHTLNMDYNFFHGSNLPCFAFLSSYLLLSLVLISEILSCHENDLLPPDVRYLDWFSE